MKAKRILSMLLAGLMVAGMSVSAFANETGTKTDDSTPPAQETPSEAPEGDYSVMPLGTPDGTAPVLKSVAISNTVAEPGETLTLTIDATDDVSGIYSIEYRFENSENGRDIWGILINDDEEISNKAPYEMSINVNELEPDGIFYLKYILMRDVSGNSVYYYSKEEKYADIFLPNEISFSVAENIEEDGIAPVLNSISLNGTSVEAPGTLTLTIDATDDVSGIYSIEYRFENSENGRDIWGILINDDEEISNEAPYEMPVNISEFEPSGIFYLKYILMRDVSGNSVYYYSKEENYADIFLPNELSFTVTQNSKADGKYPVLNSVKLDSTSVEAPGSLTLTIDATDDVSGIYSIEYRFENSENGRDIWGILINDDEEISNEAPYEMPVNISEFEPSGIFYLKYILMRDVSGNDVYYYSKEENYADVFLPNEISFFVKNSDYQEDGETVGDIVTSTLSSTLVTDVDNMSNNGTAYIYYGNDATLPKEVFSAIDNTEKTLVLSSDGIQWEFDGKTVDANKAKDLELDVDIERDRRSDSENAGDIEEALGTKNSIIVSFPENGELPGPAKIRIKMDHVFKEYVGTENLYVYYYDNTTGEFVEVASKLKITADSYLEFTITHNSDFVIMNGEYVKPEDKPEDNTDNKPTWTPSYDDDEDEDVVVLEDDKEKITVEEFANGTVKSNRKSASKGQKVTLTVTPDDGYVLKSLTVTNSKGKEVEVTEKNGKYYFEMPSTKVSIDAEFVKADVASAEKTNPETGAGDVANVSVAFAVCSVLCGAVLVSKKR